MKAFCVEITKVIAVTVEAESYDEAVDNITAEFADGEYGQSWDRAERQFKLLDEAELE